MMSGYRLRKACLENKGVRLDRYMGRARTAGPQITDCSTRMLPVLPVPKLAAGAKLCSLRNQTQHVALLGDWSISHNCTGKTTAQVGEQGSA